MRHFLKGKFALNFVSLLDCLIEAYNPGFCTNQSWNLNRGYTQQDIPSTTQR